MFSKIADGAFTLAPSAVDQAPFHIIADHPSLRRSLCALLNAWDRVPLAFEHPRTLLRHRRSGADRPACTIIDMSGLDIALSTLIQRLRTLDEQGPILILHGSNQRLERELRGLKRRNIMSLIKPYRVHDLLDVIEKLTGSPLHP